MVFQRKIRASRGNFVRLGFLCFCSFTSIPWPLLPAAVVYFICSALNSGLLTLSRRYSHFLLLSTAGFRGGSSCPAPQPWPPALEVVCPGCGATSLTYPQIFKMTPVIYGIHSPQLAAVLDSVQVARSDWLKTCIHYHFALEKPQYPI